MQMNQTKVDKGSSFKYSVSLGAASKSNPDFFIDQISDADRSDVFITPDHQPSCGPTIDNGL